MSLSSKVIGVLAGAACVTLSFAVPVSAAELQTKPKPNSKTLQDHAQPQNRAPLLNTDVQASQPTAESSDVVMSKDLSSRSDVELTALTAQWSQLSPSERRRLLAEVRGRMAASRTVRRPIGIKVQRQYGRRVVRKADGTVVVQTTVVQVTPRVVTQDKVQRGRVTFGIGFEQRSKRRSQPVTASVDSEHKAPPNNPTEQDSPIAPVVTVSNESTAKHP